MTDAHKIAEDQLLSIIERVESLEADIKALNADKSEVYQEAKANGFDIAILKKLVAERRKPAAERSEEEAILELYREAAGRAYRARIRTKSPLEIEVRQRADDTREFYNGDSWQRLPA